MREARTQTLPETRSMTCSGLNLLAAVAFSALCLSGAPAALAHDSPDHEKERPLFEGWPDELFDPETFDFDKERLSDEARRAVEDFLALVSPLMDQLSIAIEDLPRYEAPVILPNGDILIRKKREPGHEAPPPGEVPGREDPDDRRKRSDGSYDL